ncbi:MAG: hypothetical protein ACYS80_01275 [Planctomycetota bacterium]|jgi:hypothetical protein
MYKDIDIGTDTNFQLENTDFYFVAVGSKVAIMASGLVPQSDKMD